MKWQGKLNLIGLVSAFLCLMTCLITLSALAQTQSSGPGEPVPQLEDDDDDDDWDEKTPVDTSLHFSGVAAFGARLTYFAEHNYGLAERIEDERTFQLEHTHVKVTGNISDEISFELLPCLTHMEQFSMITAFFTYDFTEYLSMDVGRFILPFGQFNARSLPGSFTPISRPLLYQSHEDRFIQYGDDSPANFLFTPRDDQGLHLKGSVWLGDELQIWYGAYVVNGLDSQSNTMARNWQDKNNGKAVGGRLVTSLNQSHFDVSLGISYLENEYETELNQRAYGGDIELGFKVMERTVLRGEYVYSEREIVPNEDVAKGDEKLNGWYVGLESKLSANFEVFFQYDQLTNEIPKVRLNETFYDLELNLRRFTSGLIFYPDPALAIKLEYGKWMFTDGLPDADRIGLQSILTF